MGMGWVYDVIFELAMASYRATGVLIGELEMRTRNVN